jgi:hypothetical protein
MLSIANRSHENDLRGALRQRIEMIATSCLLTILHIASMILKRCLRCVAPTQLTEGSRTMRLAAGKLRRQPWLWTAVAALLGSAPAALAETPACGPETAGQLSAQAGVRCECVRVPEGSITGTSAGYAWDCGVLRGRMNQLVPPAPDAYQGSLTDGLIIDADDRGVRRGKSRH